MANKKKKPVSGRGGSMKVRARKSPRRRDHTVGSFAFPLLICGFLVVCLAVFGYTFYQSATSSVFFKVRSIDVRGTDRVPADDIRRVVASSAEKTGSWNVDLDDIRAKIEKMPFVKAAAVTRMLPAGVRVDVTERIPVAVVGLTSGNSYVDQDGVILARAPMNDAGFPIVLQGWEESKTPAALPDNLNRLKVYKKMIDEWKSTDIAGRVKGVNLANLREPLAIVEDSGHEIAVILARDNFARSLKNAIDAIRGKGGKIKSVDAEGASPIITYLDFVNE